MGTGPKRGFVWVPGPRLLERNADLRCNPDDLRRAYREIEVKPNQPYSNDPDFRVWLSIPVPLIQGNLARAKPVVHVRPRGPLTVIQFWYFYPFNGPGRLRICWEHCEYEQFRQAGRHWGDWEMVSLLVDNATGATVAAGLSQHGTVQWVQYAQLEKHTDGIRPLVYAALNSHGRHAPAPSRR